MDAVVHSGALTTDWGDKKDFYDINVKGTENVISGCRTHQVKRLVYISSPSVISKEAAQFDINENDPLPENHLSLYALTKKLGEYCVQKAHENGLETLILRPKAIYGPGDNVLFPRLIKAASKGRLPIVGDGKTVVNLTHVDDVVQAILLALKTTSAIGNTYFITGGENIKLWDLIGDLLKRLGVAKPKRRLSVRSANAIADAMTMAWRLLPLPGEPLLTRYKVATLAFSQTLDISAAVRDLGYKPKVSISEGLAHFVASLDEPADNKGPEFSSRPDAIVDQKNTIEVKASLLNAGICRHLERVFLPGGRNCLIDIPSLFAVFEHPKEGIILFDTGYSTRFFSGTQAMPHSFYRLITPVHIHQQENASEQLKNMSIMPSDIKWIILSHFDPDHYGGLRDFPNAHFICSWRAWSAVKDAKKFSLTAFRMLPDHLPEDFTARLCLLEDPTGPPVGPFSASKDLFEDGSIRLISLPGHAPGQIGAFVRVTGGNNWLLAADSVWSRRAINLPKARVHYALAYNRLEQKFTYQKLKRLVREQPDTVVIPSHCCDAADELVSNKSWKN
jgi:nucleoside-diphosphate-sugar epimerase/glyoxylase-like metal-dependent hydrolase (beta-lactamase superfamily II)